MDRETADAHAAGRRTVGVVGRFDPLLAEHARRLQELAEPGALLIVEVSGHAGALIPQRGRAEIVAALTCVDYVVPGGPEETELIDGGLAEQFAAQVLQRNGRSR